MPKQKPTENQQTKPSVLLKVDRKHRKEHIQSAHPDLYSDLKAGDQRAVRACFVRASEVLREFETLSATIRDGLGDLNSPSCPTEVLDELVTKTAYAAALIDLGSTYRRSERIAQSG